MEEGTGTFWDHLEELRNCLLRIVGITVTVAVVAFALKGPLFDIVLAPTRDDFFVYRLIGAGSFHINLINTGLTEQLMMHLKMALYAGLLMASPYVSYELFQFISPALYQNERRYTVRATGSAYLLFIIGTVVNYVLIFPFTLRFLGTYQVSEEVTNMLTLQSYVDTLINMSLMMGLVFELPVLCWLLAKTGVLTSSLMRQYRRHAVVAILVVAAIITPTTDVFTLTVVSLPIWGLFEFSIFIVGMTEKGRKEEDTPSAPATDTEEQ